MKNKITFMLCTVLCFLSGPVFAEDFFYFGSNYSNTIANGNMSQGIGAHFSALGDYGGAKKIYSAIGFVADISSNRDLNTNELKRLGVSGMNTRFYSIPMRIGYPAVFDINTDMRFMLIPALAFDINFFHANFTQKLYGYKINYDMSGWGYALGVAVDVGMQHKVNKILLRYGVDLDFRMLSILLVDIKYSGYVNCSRSGVASNTMADYFMLTTSPYVSIGFKL